MFGIGDFPGRQLSIPLSGVGRLTLIPPTVADRPGKIVDSEEITMAAWQTPIKGTPMRVMVRCDGNIIDHKANFVAPGTFTSGFPCGVLEVRYTSGGYQRITHVDAINQSALVVWADNVEVTAKWDRRRIARLFPGSVAPLVPAQLPCFSQALAAAISVDDQGQGNARYLDAILPDPVFSVHPIPPGARAIVLRRGAQSPGGPDGNIALYEGTWTANPELPVAPTLLQGVVDKFTNPCFDAPINIPAGSEFLMLVRTSVDVLFNSQWVEFILTPEPLYSECCCDTFQPFPPG